MRLDNSFGALETAKGYMALLGWLALLSTDFSVSAGKLPGAGLEQCASRAADHIEPLAAITVGDAVRHFRAGPEQHNLIGLRWFLPCAHGSSLHVRNCLAFILPVMTGYQMPRCYKHNEECAQIESSPDDYWPSTPLLVNYILQFKKGKEITLP